MLKRIISKKSAYPHLQYEKESRQNKYRVENICQYPYQLGRNTSPDYKYNSNNVKYDVRIQLYILYYIGGNV